MGYDIGMDNQLTAFLPISPWGWPLLLLCELPTVCSLHGRLPGGGVGPSVRDVNDPLPRSGATEHPGGRTDGLPGTEPAHSGNLAPEMVKGRVGGRADPNHFHPRGSVTGSGFQGGDGILGEARSGVTQDEGAQTGTQSQIRQTQPTWFPALSLQSRGSKAVHRPRVEQKGSGAVPRPGLRGMGPQDSALNLSSQSTHLRQSPSWGLSGGSDGPGGPGRDTPQEGATRSST